MSRLTDKISYLQGLAEGMKLNPEKDSHRLILGILEVLGEAGDSFEALAEAHQELREYVESIDEDLADLEDCCYEDDDEDLPGDEEELIEYECPHCGGMIEIEPDEVDFDDETLCPFCGKDLFPELPEETDGEEEPDNSGEIGKADEGIEEEPLTDSEESETEDSGD